MKNYVVRVISENGRVLGLACITTDLVEEACQLHCASATASAALGRALTGGALMASLLKKDQRLALKFEGNGPLKKIIVEADHAGTVRGFAAVPDADLPPRGKKLDVSGVLGKEGFLTVIKDLGAKEPYTGIVGLRTGEIAEDLAYYFAESEQIPTAMGLGVFVEPPVRVTAAGGFLIQTLPPPDEAIVDGLVQRIGKMQSVTELLRKGHTPEEMLEMIFADIPFHYPGEKRTDLEVHLFPGEDRTGPLLSGAARACRHDRRSRRSGRDVRILPADVSLRPRQSGSASGRNEYPRLGRGIPPQHPEHTGFPASREIFRMGKSGDPPLNLPRGFCMLKGVGKVRVLRHNSLHPQARPKLSYAPTGV